MPLELKGLEMACLSSLWRLNNISTFLASKFEISLSNIMHE